MDIDGASNAKAEIFREVFGFFEIPVAHEVPDSSSGARRILPTFVPGGNRSSALASKAELPLSDQDPARLIGIGLSPEARSRRKAQQFELVILCQRKALLQHDMVQNMVRLAKGEARAVYTGQIRKQVGRQLLSRKRPVGVGCSIGHYRVTAGTLGGFINLGSSGGTCILSNNHVIANVNTSLPGDEILQPGRVDGGKRPEDIVGFLHRTAVIDFSPSSVNFADCAAATIVDGCECNHSDVVDPENNIRVGRITGQFLDELDLEQPVLKVGRTTGLTRGNIFAIEVDNLTVNMGSSQKPKLARFDNQIQTYSQNRHFSKGGDSGSLVLNDRLEVCGLLFAGSERGAPGGFGLTSVNPIAAVCSTLNGSIQT